jgi:hypothetical protein
MQLSTTRERWYSIVLHRAVHCLYLGKLSTQPCNGGLGDSSEQLCVFLISNPSRGMQSVMWRGKEYMSAIESR